MELDWMDGTVEKMPGDNILYRIVCFLMGRRKKKLTFKELYLLLRKINEKSLGVENSDKMALLKIIEIYKKQEGKSPGGILK